MSEICKLRVLELYSGIGGMHYALKESGLPFEVVAAIDVNTTANQIYRHNFKETYLMECGIETLTVTQIDRMKIDMILMSPPCQPFTRVGKKLDSEDLRTKSFLHLLDLLPQLTHCPSYVLVENVKGFEESQTRDILIKSLTKCNFKIQEYLLSPLQFGVPNSRLRYYLIAKRHQQDQECTWPEASEICQNIPSIVRPYLKYRISCDNEKTCNHSYPEEETLTSGKLLEDTVAPNECKSKQDNVKIFPDISNEENESTGNNEEKEINCDSEQCVENEENIDKTSCTKKLKTKHLNDTQQDAKHHKEEDNCRLCINDYHLLEEGQMMRQDNVTEVADNKCLQLKSFMEEEDPEYFNKYKVPDKDLKRFIVMDVVLPFVRKSICFTKRYGHYMEGAGSIIQMSTDIEAVRKAIELKSEALKKKNNKSWGEREISIIRNLNLRYFTPREIANLLCFPSTFSFPDDVSTIQSYRVLGNSLNVHVVSVLLRLLTIK